MKNTPNSMKSYDLLGIAKYVPSTAPRSRYIYLKNKTSEIVMMGIRRRAARYSYRYQYS